MKRKRCWLDHLALGATQAIEQLGEYLRLPAPSSTPPGASGAPETAIQVRQSKPTRWERET